MRTLSLASLALVVAMSAPVGATTPQTQTTLQNQSKMTKQARQARPAATNRRVRQVRSRQAIQPTWDRCFKMSVDRGFDHDEFGEWRRSIQECLEGKIPL